METCNWGRKKEPSEGHIRGREGEFSAMQSRGDSKKREKGG